MIRGNILQRGKIFLKVSMVLSACPWIRRQLKTKHVQLAEHFLAAVLVFFPGVLWTANDGVALGKCSVGFCLWSLVLPSDMEYMRYPSIRIHVDSFVDYPPKFSRGPQSLHSILRPVLESSSSTGLLPL